MKKLFMIALIYCLVLSYEPAFAEITIGGGISRPDDKLCGGSHIIIAEVTDGHVRDCRLDPKYDGHYCTPQDEVNLSIKIKRVLAKRTRYWWSESDQEFYHVLDLREGTQISVSVTLYNDLLFRSDPHEPGLVARPTGLPLTEEQVREHIVGGEFIFSPDAWFVGKWPEASYGTSMWPMTELGWVKATLANGGGNIADGGGGRQPCKRFVSNPSAKP